MAALRCRVLRLVNVRQVWVRTRRSWFVPTNPDGHRGERTSCSGLYARSNRRDCRYGADVASTPGLPPVDSPTYCCRRVRTRSLPRMWVGGCLIGDYVPTSG